MCPKGNAHGSRVSAQAQFQLRRARGDAGCRHFFDRDRLVRALKIIGEEVSMSATIFLDGDFPVSSVMTCRFGDADVECEVAFPEGRRPSVSLWTTVEEATHIMALTGLRQIWVK